MGGHHLNEFLSPFIKFLASIIESFLPSMSVQNDDNHFCIVVNRKTFYADNFSLTFRKYIFANIFVYNFFL